MKVALYARVSTSDRDQNTETQLVPLREFADVSGWVVYKEYIDTASANDLRNRKAWRQLLDDGARRRFEAVVVFKLDRAFRSVKDMYDTLSAWDLVGVDFRSIREQFDTGTPIGRLLMTMLAAIAEFELELIRERVRAGMERARKQGIKLGRPRVTDRPGFEKRFGAVLARLQSGEISRREASRELKIGFATLKRLIDSRG